MKLLIDDGVQTRGHRNHLFDRTFKEMGCYSGKHAQQLYITSIAYAHHLFVNDSSENIATQELLLGKRPSLTAEYTLVDVPKYTTQPL